MATRIDIAQAVAKLALAADRAGYPDIAEHLNTLLVLDPVRRPVDLAPARFLAVESWRAEIQRRGRLGGSVKNEKRAAASRRNALLATAARKARAAERRAAAQG